MTDPKIIKVISAEGQSRVYEMDDGSVVERTGGTAAWRNNNPGNLKFELPKNADETAKQKRLGDAQALYDGVVGLDERGMAIFESPEAGQRAQLTLAERKQDMTVEQYVRFYAKDDYAGKANHDAYAQKIYAVGDENGVNLRDKTLGQMNQKEKDVLVGAMKQVEGFKQGETKQLRDPAKTEAYLQIGDFGAEVGALRDNLAKLGYKSLFDHDNYYGYSTYQAVSKFQKEHGLPVTGAADLATLEKVGNLLPAGKTPQSMYNMQSDSSPSGDQNKPQQSLQDARYLKEYKPSDAILKMVDDYFEKNPVRHGNASDETHRNLSAALMLAAARSNLDDVDRVMLNKDGTRLIAVQGDERSDSCKTSSVVIQDAIKQPAQESLAQIAQIHTDKAAGAVRPPTDIGTIAVKPQQIENETRAALRLA